MQSVEALADDLGNVVTCRKSTPMQPVDFTMALHSSSPRDGVTQRLQGRSQRSQAVSTTSHLSIIYKVPISSPCCIVLFNHDRSLLHTCVSIEAASAVTLCMGRRWTFLSLELRQPHPSQFAVGRVRPEPSGDRLGALHIYRWMKKRSSRQVAWMAITVDDAHFPTAR